MRGYRRNIVIVTRVPIRGVWVAFALALLANVVYVVDRLAL